jgi:hypothetical protein
MTYWKVKTLFHLYIPNIKHIQGTQQSSSTRINEFFLWFSQATGRALRTICGMKSLKRHQYSMALE